MSDSTVISAEVKNHFWDVVVACLVIFHKRPVSLARKKVCRLREKVEGDSVDTRDFFYHQEPFDVACRVEGNALEIEPHLKRYLELRDVKNPFSLTECE